MLVAMFLAATNYKLNLGFMMVFLLFGIALVNTFMCFRNLAYLRLSVGTPQAIFAGELAQFPVFIENTQKLDRYAIYLDFEDRTQAKQAIDIEKNNRVALCLAYPSQQRGHMAIPRIRLETWFPLGLLRAWTYWLPEANVLVYPHPESGAPPLPLTETRNQDEGQQQQGNEDFSGVRTYQAGDPLKLLSWKHNARVDLDAGGHLVSKLFSGGAKGELFLDFATLPLQVDLELRLSRMCAWVLEAEQQGLQYAFKLGAFSVTTNSGENHRNTCLQALALYGA